jgi:hypothetical protein
MAGEAGRRLKAPEKDAARGDGRVEEEQLETPEAEAAAAGGNGREEEEIEDQPARLPEDVLAAILRRVQPRWLAASRCVCRAWRDAVDGRRLLRADLLPLSFAGIFIHFNNNHKFPEFFARPTSSASGARTVSGNLSLLPSDSPHCGSIWDDDCLDFDDYNIKDHCNGLLLLSGNYVVNPATRWWHTLPICPAMDETGYVLYQAHLVYDPMVSPHYEVFNVPFLRGYRPRDETNFSMEESEWPPSPCKMYVFSSKLGCWEVKYFIRDGDAVGTVREMRKSWLLNTVYFQGALYVYYKPGFLMRYTLFYVKFFIETFILLFFKYNVPFFAEYRCPVIRTM